MDATRGFYAAEAGLNLRAERIRQEFVGFLRPTGTSPADGGGMVPCVGSNQGSGDFACESDALGSHVFETYVTEDASNPTSIVVPPGEPFEYLNAQRYAYQVHSTSLDDDDRPEAILDLEFNSRLVALFQFAAFYNKDLELHPGPPMTLAGPMHSNGDLYLGSMASLSIVGQVTTAGDLYQVRKNDMTCYGGDVKVPDPGTLTALPTCPSAATVLYDQATLDAGWNGTIRTGLDPLTVPPPETFDPTPGSFYWDNAEVRIVLDVNGGTPVIELRRQNNTVDVAGTATLIACGPVGDRAVSDSNSFYNIREGKTIRMLDVNVEQLMNCLHDNPSLMGGKTLDEATGGGLVWYLTVDGPDSGIVNGYGTRVTNSAELASSVSGAPAIRGLTVISDQAAYTHGHFNSVNKAPAAIMADSLNILSGAYVDGDHVYPLGDANRNASATTVNAGFLAGTDVTGGAEGVAGQNGAYNGGLENYPRFHERWNGVTLTYLGSFVSLYEPEHVSGPHTTPGLYEPPIRDWGFDTDFNDAANLPPLTPRFVYLKQDLFVREFEY